MNSESDISDLFLPPPDFAFANGLVTWGCSPTTERLLKAYEIGIFPQPIHYDLMGWWSPDPRTVLFLHDFRVSKSFKKKCRKSEFETSVDRAFEDVIRNCAYRLSKPTMRVSKNVPPYLKRYLHELEDQNLLTIQEQSLCYLVRFVDRETATKYTGYSTTWITPEIIDAYLKLHDLGHAHSIETWHEGKLVGGLYGVSMGTTFSGESMYSHKNDASKIALCRLVQVLREWDYDFIDCQETTPMLWKAGATELPRSRFRKMLEDASKKSPSSNAWNISAKELSVFEI